MGKGRWDFLLLSIVLSGSVLLPVGSQIGAQAQTDAPSQPSAKQTKQQKASDKQLLKELETPYKKWLDEDVAYIISPAERKAFLQLQTNEEREEFIEQFWQRRNPDPDSSDNPVKEEHYRRIAYANEHFASGMAGWKTDRGRIYIIWGKPDELETHTLGETWERPMDLGGGETQTYAYDDWTYNEMEGIGQNVTLEFVDQSGTGEFKLTSDPSAKDALTNVPGAGDTLAEDEGLSSRQARFMNTDGSTMPSPLGGFRSASLDEFNRMDQYNKVQQAPPVKFKDLESMVTSRIVRDQIPFTYRFDFLRVTGDTVLVPITVQIPNRGMGFKVSDGVHTATLDLFARISTLSGRVVQTFEDTIRRDFPDSLLEQSLAASSIYQKAVPLRPGLYRLDIVLKDVGNNNVGVVNTRLAVPPFEDDKLATSSLILADQMVPVASKEIGIGQFVIGSMKVRPKLDQSFTTAQQMGIFLQLYNLKTDEKTHKNNASVDVQVFQGDKQVAHLVQTSEQLKQTGEEITLEQSVPLAALPPGKYRLQIQATDAIANQTVSRTTDFTVSTAASDSKAAAQASPGR
jgi:GWxTD domain-containing protein